MGGRAAGTVVGQLPLAGAASQALLDELVALDPDGLAPLAALACQAAPDPVHLSADSAREAVSWIENPGTRVIDAVKTRLAEIQAGLPEGVEVVVTYDRSELIEDSI